MASIAGIYLAVEKVAVFIALLAAVLLVAMLIFTWHVATRTEATKIQNATHLLDYINLTGVGTLDPMTSGLQYFDIINNVSYVGISLNQDQVSPGQYVAVNVSFIGTFGWYAATEGEGSPMAYYLNSTIANYHYYGVELSNQTGMLLDKSNGPWWRYIAVAGAAQAYSPSNSIFYMVWRITPNASTVGQTLKLCGGYFAAFDNVSGGYTRLFDVLSYYQRKVVNSTVIDIPSYNCRYLKVV